MRQVRLILECALLASAAGTVGCGAGSAGAAKAPAGSPEQATTSSSDSSAFQKGDLRELYKRELPAGPKAALSVGSVTGDVESSAPPKGKAGEDSIQFEFPLAHTNVTCFVYPGQLDAGAQLLKITKALAEKFEIRSVTPKDVVVVGEDVALFVEAQYLVKTERGQALGLLKSMVYTGSTPSTPMLCLHDEVGYTETFKRVTLGLAGSLKRTGVAPRTEKYLELYVTKLDGHPTGFSRERIVEGPKGVVFEENSTDLIPRSPVDLTATDTAIAETWDKTGGISEIRYAHGDGEEVDTMVLKRAGANAYSYDGTHHGKKVHGDFKTKGARGLRTQVEEHAAIRGLLSPKGNAKADLRFEKYSPGMDPTAPMEERLQLLSKPDRKVTLSLGEMQITEVVDENGRMAQGEMPLGPVHLTVERVLVRGAE
jgi:hypothetical protein